LESQRGALNSYRLKASPKQLGPSQGALLKTTDERIALDPGSALLPHLAGVLLLVGTRLWNNLPRSTGAPSNPFSRLGREGV
jgi:hypothetical protein